MPLIGVLRGQRLRDQFFQGTGFGVLLFPSVLPLKRGVAVALPEGEITWPFHLERLRAVVKPFLLFNFPERKLGFAFRGEFPLSAACERFSSRSRSSPVFFHDPSAKGPKAGSSRMK